MNIQTLYEELEKQIIAGKGQVPVAFGDCNSLHIATATGIGYVEELGTYYLEEVGSEDGGVEVFIIGE